MTDKKPKDYLMGEAAYNAFYQQQPQIFFDDLAHKAQMRWVEVARAVTLVHDGYKHKKDREPKSGRIFKGSEQQRAIWRAQAEKAREKRATKKSG